MLPARVPSVAEMLKAIFKIGYLYKILSATHRYTRPNEVELKKSCGVWGWLWTPIVAKFIVYPTLYKHVICLCEKNSSQINLIYLFEPCTACFGRTRGWWSGCWGTLCSYCGYCPLRSQIFFLKDNTFILIDKFRT